MKAEVKKILEKHTKLLYLAKCLYEFKDAQFVDDVLAIDYDPFQFRFHQLGEYNKDKNILWITIDYPSGFFACFRTALMKLAVADRFGFAPVIEYKNTIYSEAHPVFDTMNAFEYYFKQPAGISPEEGLQSYNVAFARGQELAYRKLLFAELVDYAPSSKSLASLASIQKKYIRLNSQTDDFMRRTKKDVQNKKTLGVHVRGTDYKKELKGHPLYISAGQYLSNTDKALKEMGFEQIFLATDEKNIVDLFQSRYKDKVVFYEDVLRSDDNKPIHYSQPHRENHKYVLGLEVLRDMLTLSECDGLIGGLSKVTTAARITKASLEREYTYMDIMDNGLK